MPESRKQILVVDDEPDIIEMLELLLESEGYEVLGATGGAEALSMLQTNRPDFVLLDLMMPDVDGHEVCRGIRSRDELASLPVFMLTAKNDIEHIAMALDEGANGFIVKPFDTEHLLRILEFRLAGKHSEFYRSDTELQPLEGDPKGQIQRDERIVFMDLIEPEDQHSRVVLACKEESYNLLSLWQREISGGRVETTALLNLESSEHFGHLLNAILEDPRVQILNSSVFENFDEIPADIM